MYIHIHIYIYPKYPYKPTRIRICIPILRGTCLLSPQSPAPESPALRHAYFDFPDMAKLLPEPRATGKTHGWVAAKELKNKFTMLCVLYIANDDRVSFKKCMVGTWLLTQTTESKP